LFCIGVFYGEEKDMLLPYKNGSKKVPIPTYVITDEDIDDKELKDTNITILNKPDILIVSDLIVVSIPLIEINKQPLTLISDSIKSILTLTHSQEFKAVDILLTIDWPKGILNGLKDQQYPTNLSLENQNIGSNFISEVCLKIIPRYHFVSSPNHKLFYERLPYINPSVGDKKYPITRFLSLAEAFNTDNARYLYAFLVEPINLSNNPTIYDQLPTSTPNPFQVLNTTPASKRPRTELAPDQKRFSGTIDDERPNYAQNKRSRNLTHLNNNARMNECWFCLSSSVCEHHMIILVGKFFYLAIAKGGINDSHLLLVSVLHIPNQLFLSSPASGELKQWMNALTKFFSDRGEPVIFFEHNYPTNNQHMHIQVVPFPLNQKNRAKEYFMNEGRNFKLSWITLEEKDTIRHDIGNKDNFLWVKLPDGKQLLASFEQKIPFSFGRRVLCYLWGNPELDNWKNCVLPTQQEDKITKSLRIALEPYITFLSPSK